MDSKNPAAPTAQFEAAYFETRFRTSAPVSHWPERFAIITAYATTGEMWTQEQNEAADKVLAAELRATGNRLVRITGYSPTTGHAEPGWAVELAVAEAKDLGKRFKQDAVYVVTRDGVEVMKSDGFVRAFIGGFKTRLDA